MKHIICIVAKTGRGKDTLAKQIKKNLGIEQICSYTTRPKRDYEVDGKEHYFITNEQADEILYKETILALACKPNGVRYFATLESFTENRIVYIIDPEGIKWMQEHVAKKNLAKLFIVELYARNESIEERIKVRGDDIDTYLKRIEYEDIEFEEFHKSEYYDVSIPATLPIDRVYEEFVKAYRDWLEVNDDWSNFMCDDDLRKSYKKDQLVIFKNVDFDAVKEDILCKVLEVNKDTMTILDIETDTKLYIERGFNLEFVSPTANSYESAMSKMLGE